MKYSIYFPKSASMNTKPSTSNLLILFLLLFTSHSTVYGQSKLDPVSPLQTGHYMPGFMSVRDFADPAPASGLIVLDYNIYQYGDELYGTDGHKVTEITGPEGTVDLNSDLNGYINNPMFIYAAKKKILGATYFGGISLPYVTVSTNLAYSRIGNITGNEKSGDVSGQVSGFSDLNVLPVYLSWAKPTYNITAATCFTHQLGNLSLEVMTIQD